jgi:hypothetical protein
MPVDIAIAVMLEGGFVIPKNVALTDIIDRFYTIDTYAFHMASQWDFTYLAELFVIVYSATQSFQHLV